MRLMQEQAALAAAEETKVNRKAIAFLSYVNLDGQHDQGRLPQFRERMLCLAQGAEEVWICSQNGTMRFFSAEGVLERSSLVPQFPAHLEL